MSNSPTNTPAEHEDAGARAKERQDTVDAEQGIGVDPDLGLTSVVEMNARLNAAVDGAAETDKVVEEPAMTVEALQRLGIEAKSGPQKSV